MAKKKATTEKAATKVAAKAPVKGVKIKPSKFIGPKYEGKEILKGTFVEDNGYVSFRTADGFTYKIQMAEYLAL